jgi:hypothetical protein
VLVRISPGTAAVFTCFPWLSSVIQPNPGEVPQLATAASVSVHDLSNHSTLYRVSQEERSILSEVIGSVILSKTVYMHMCPVSNSFRDRGILLYSDKTVHKKEILHTVANTGIYCSSDKVSTVYLV